MNKFLILSLVALLGGCASYSQVTPNYDARFGDAVRQARLQMTINPDAGRNPDQALGMDGIAAREGMLLYQGAAKAPAPVTNVINIGGGVAGN
jgi:hypothetical protein